MKKVKLLSFALLAVLFLLPEAPSQAQVGGGVKLIGDQAVDDSIRKAEYPYALPFLAQKVQQRGFRLPYPVGVMINGFAGKQDVTISDLQVGFNGGQMYGLDSIVVFDKSVAHTQDVSLRIDLWVLPFLNVYGIYGSTWVHTEIGLREPIQLSTTVDFHGATYGFGATAATGLNNFFFTLDYNSVWSSFTQIDKPVYAQMITPRVGYTVHFKGERNLAFWLSASRLYLSRTTSGQIDLGSMVPDFDGSRLLPIINSTKDDYPDMSLVKYQVMKTAATDLYNNLPQINDQKNKTVIDYSLNKRPSHKFTGAIGMQYQLNRRYQFRTEIGLLGGRTSALFSVNYRFGL